MRLLRDLAPLLGLLLVFMVVLALDPASVLWLVWSCVTGAFGTLVQVGVAALLVAGTAITVVAFWVDEPVEAAGRSKSPAAKRKRKAGTRAPRKRKPPQAGGESAIETQTAAMQAPVAEGATQ